MVRSVAPVRLCIGNKGSRDDAQHQETLQGYKQLRAAPRRCARRRPGLAVDNNLWSSLAAHMHHEHQNVHVIKLSPSVRTRDISIGALSCMGPHEIAVPLFLLAQLEQRVRQVKPSADAWKHDPDSGEQRPFGGINLVLIGDFKQLPPPQGGYLADIPHRHMLGPIDPTKAPDPMADAGKTLMWQDIQGSVELTERERCKDEWWNEVTDELRACKLSDKNYKYLHGLPVEGCQLSPEERASRRRVITGPDDPRLQLPKFLEAPLIVANNDSKYQVNKDRARKYARDAGAELRWAPAKDVASSEALQAQICDKDRKIKRLGSIGSFSFRVLVYFRLGST